MYSGYGAQASSASTSAQPYRPAFHPALPQQWPGKKGKGLFEPQWRACRDMLEKVYSARDGSRDLSAMFQELPSRAEFPDYYEEISAPECLNNVATVLGDQGYKSPERFFIKLHLIFQNAKSYNAEDSQIYQDAVFLERLIHDDWRAFALQGIFSDPDPTVNAPRKPGRPRKDEPPRPPQPTPVRRMPAPPPTATPSGYDVASPSYTPGGMGSSSPWVPQTAAYPGTPSYGGAPGGAAAGSAYPQQQLMGAGGRVPSSPYQSSTTAIPPLPTDPPVRNGEPDEVIMARLDAQLPKWSGPPMRVEGPEIVGGIPGSGYWGEAGDDVASNTGAGMRARIDGMMAALEGYRSADNARLAEVLERVLPDSSSIPYLSYSNPLSLADFRGPNAKDFDSLHAFDHMMVRFFEKARRYFPVGAAEYGKVLVLQRLYNALTAAKPLSLPEGGGPLPPAATNFAAIPAGPGQQKTLQDAQQEARVGQMPDEGSVNGLTTYRVSTKDREFTTEARYKGQVFRIGDYVHLINPSDATRPIVGQIWKTWVPTKGNTQQHHVTVCWYYRPEQTVHTADRMFFENEVFKSGHFCDHPVEDILERISVQFYVKYIRGKPRAPEYFPGWPHYICNSRYNDREWLSIRIKNWASCIPEELRQTEYMSIVPYDRQLDPVQIRSPFLRNVRGVPGFIADPKRQPDAEDDDEYEGARDSARPPRGTPARPGYPGADTPQVPLPSGMGAGAAAGFNTPGPRTATPAAYPPQRPVGTPGMPGGPTSATGLSSSGLQGPATPGSQLGPGAPRSIAAAMGGAQAAHNIAVVEQLPIETARLFERDQHRQVLWFSGPPLPVGAVKIPEQPSHTLEYLTYLAKRKRGQSAASARPEPRKRSAQTHESDKPVQLDLKAQLETEEDEQKAVLEEWWAQGLSKDQVIASLKATADAVSVL